MAVEMPGVLSGAFSGVGSKITGTLVSFLWGIGILLVLGVMGFIIYRGYKNKATYTIPISLTTLMSNGMEKTRHDLKGGMFMNNGIRDFKIKAPRKIKTHTLGYMPDLSKSISTDGRIYFITSGDNTLWQQYETKWILNKEYLDSAGNSFKEDLVKIPVPREIKQATVNSLKNWRETIDKAKLTAFGIAIGAFIIMVIAHLISLFIQTRIKCGVPA